MLLAGFGPILYKVRSQYLQNLQTIRSVFLFTTLNQSDSEKKIGQ